jgi:ribose/xylose/arabinose/galactoside ABC-type transport system permease subunit
MKGRVRKILRIGEGQFRNLALLIALGIGLAIITSKAPSFLSGSNLAVILLAIAPVGICAVGMAVLIIAGTVDLSIGSIYALTAVIAAMLARDMPVPVALIIGTLSGGILGGINGILVRRINISPLIVTLGSLTLLEGVVLVLTQGSGITGDPASFTVFGGSEPGGIPTPVIAFVVLAIMVGLVLHTTKTGRHIYAVGGNSNASEASGINVPKLIIGAFVVNGLIVGLAGTMGASQIGSADPNFGTTLVFDVITAVILGGVAFNGGEGTMLGVCLAVALIGVIDSGLITLQVDPYYTDVVKGGALILAVGLDQVTSEARERRRRQIAMEEYGRRRDDAVTGLRAEGTLLQRSAGRAGD